MVESAQDNSACVYEQDKSAYNKQDDRAGLQSAQYKQDESARVYEQDKSAFNKQDDHALFASRFKAG